MTVFEKYPPADGVKSDPQIGEHTLCELCVPRGRVATHVMIDDSDPIIDGWHYVCRKCGEEFGMLYDQIIEL